MTCGTSDVSAISSVASDHRIRIRGEKLLIEHEDVSGRIEPVFYIGTLANATVDPTVGWTADHEPSPPMARFQATSPS